MKLLDLKPEFVRYDIRIEKYTVVDGDQTTWRERGSPTKEITGPREYMTKVDSLEQAHGIWFLCPKCFEENKGEVGTHHCQVTFEGKGAPDTAGAHGSDGSPTRWNVAGSGFEDLSITPSILLIGGCGWHGYITNGEIK